MREELSAVSPWRTETKQGVNARILRSRQNLRDAGRKNTLRKDGGKIVRSRREQTEGEGDLEEKEEERGFDMEKEGRAQARTGAAAERKEEEEDQGELAET